MKRSPRVQCIRLLAVLALACSALVLVERSNAAADNEPRTSYADHSVVRAMVRNEAQLAQLLETCPTVLSCHVGVGDVDVVADERQKRRLQRLGISFDVLVHDVQQMIDQERMRIEEAEAGGVAGTTFFGDFKDYDAIMAQLDVLSGVRPDIAQVMPVGTSIEGRAIKAIRISSSFGANPGVLITGCQHAREWISPMTAMYIATWLIENYETDPQVQTLLNLVDFYIIPIVNPDGYVYSWGPDRFWRKNRRANPGGTFGVDLNRNWPIGFGGAATSGSPGSDLYPGRNPFSEPETVAVRDFVLAHPSIVTSLDIHSYSQLVLQPWSYTETLPPSYTCIHEIGDKMSSEIYNVHGEHYPHGSGNAVIYLAGGTIHDWMFGDQGMLAYTFELRPDSPNPGFILPPEEIIPTGEEIVPAVIELALASFDPVYVAFRNGIPQYVPSDQTNVIELTTLPLAAGDVIADSEQLWWRIGTSGPFTKNSLVSLGNNDYEAVLPAAPCGEVVQFYFQFESTELGIVTEPGRAPAVLHSIAVEDVAVVFEDDMETDMGWSVGAPGDDATTGVWERIAPNQTVNSSGVVAQPGFDNPDGTGTLCWFTGQDGGPFSGGNDVDNGITTLISPILDASGPGDPYISYFRWYSNNTGSNPNTETMSVEISNDDGANWTSLEEVIFNETKWKKSMFRVADFIEPTSTMRVRFIARDLSSNGGAVVEAGVDDLKIELIDCADPPPCFGDLVTSGTFEPPGDGTVDGADLAFLLGAWGRNPGSPADLVDTVTFLPPPDGFVDGADLAVLLGAWGACQ